MLTFVTGNINKLKEVQKIIGDDVVSKNVDLHELQGSPEEIAIEKCRLASLQVSGPVFVEDTSLCFNALNGMPGVYIKWFLKAIGQEGLNNLLVAYIDKTAYAQCIIAYTEGPGKEILTFVGKTDGKIVESRGSLDFGWDSIFEPIGYDKTFAELDSDIKNSISHRYGAIIEFSKYLIRAPPN